MFSIKSNLPSKVVFKVIFDEYFELTLIKHEIKFESSVAKFILIFATLGANLDSESKLSSPTHPAFGFYQLQLVFQCCVVSPPQLF